MAKQAASKDLSNRKADRAGPAMLLDATSALMVELGTSDVSLHAIARSANVTAPLITYHFGSKEGLLLALVERDTAHSFTQLEGLLSMDVDPVTKLRIHITGIARTYARFPYLIGLFNLLLRGPDPAVASRVRDKFIMPLIDTQRKIVAEGVRAGSLRSIDPDQIYFAIVGACQYLFASRVAFHDIMEGKVADPAFVREFGDTAADILLNGLKTQPAD